jgi:hypothetical protein
MAYTINHSDGNLLVSLSPGTTNSNLTSLTLVGKNFPGYGQFMNENFIYLLENFASGTAPDNPQEGQLWWDKANGTNRVLKVYMGNSIWKRICGSSSDAIAPDILYPNSATTGDMWWDTANAQLKVYNGRTWTTVGPAFTTSTGQSGALADVLSDGSNQYVIVKFLLDNKLVAIMSKSSFTPLPSLASSGFGVINAGLNLADIAIGGDLDLKYWGNANNADKLGGSSYSVFSKLNGTTPFTAAQTISTNNGLTIGTSNELTLTAATGQAKVSSTITNNDLALYANVAGFATKLFTVGGAGAVRSYSYTGNGTPASFANVADHNIANKRYVDDAINNLGLGGAGGQTSFSANVVPSANVSYDLGSTTTWWNNIYGTAIHARYADVAERFESDAPIAPGTVVELGGAKEITAVTQELSENILGVISTQAAYLMNSGAGPDSTHPPVAVSGRVPVRVIGSIKKGDRLVSAGNGLARAGARTEITPWNVIGRALTSKSSIGEGTIEATVKLNS